MPRYHAPLERRVRVRRGPRHYELAVCLISAYMEFFCVMLVHDLQYSEILREQLLYRRKNKSQNFFALRATFSAAARPLTSRPMAAPPFESFRRACTKLPVNLCAVSYSCTLRPLFISTWVWRNEFAKLFQRNVQKRLFANF